MEKKKELDEKFSKVFKDMDLPVPTAAFPIFSAVNIGTQKYTSMEYTRAKKSCDYAVRFNDLNYGRIHFYFKFNDLNLMMLERFEVTERFDHVLKVSCSKLMIVEVTKINEKLVHYKINHNYFISFRPNIYEKD